MPEITRQPIPGTQGNTGTTLNPADYLPDMAKAKMAEDLIKQLSPVAIVSKKFIVYQGMWLSLNHVPPTYDKEGKMIDPGHPTGLDTSRRNVLYKHVETKSCNVNGESFYSIFKYLNSANIVVTQNAMPAQNAFDNQQPGIFRRAINRIFGTGNPEQVNNGSK